MLKIHFGLNFDDEIYPTQEQCLGTFICGEKGLLTFFEKQIGCGGYDNRVEHIRVEQYRYALDKYLAKNAACFFANSFKADPLACAEDLLKRRDELLLAGWNFDIGKKQKNIPERLKVFRDIEIYKRDVEKKSKESFLDFGFADRFNQIIQLIPQHKLPIEKIILNEPVELLPPHIKRILDLEFWILDVKPSTVNRQSSTDLSVFKKFIRREFVDNTKHNLKNDGSILILKANSDADAAAFLSHFLEKNATSFQPSDISYQQNKKELIADSLKLKADFSPVLLIPDKHRTIDEALIQNGLPALGLPSASLGRPTLQLLKLVTAFLWRPLEPQKILEFTTLQYKPLDDELAAIISNVISQRPGIGNDFWYRETKLFFENLQEKAGNDSTINVGKIEKQFNFWFNRNTYSFNQFVPRDEIIEIYKHLREWAHETFETNGSKNTSLLVLGEQARRVEEYLEELSVTGKNFLSRLEIERIIRTVYEAAPVQPMPQQVGCFPFVKNECCITENINDLIWWQFVEQETPFFYSAWYPDEINWLTEQNILLHTPKQKTELWLWKQKQPIERVQRRLILVEMHKCQGENKNEHALMSYLRACFNDIGQLKINCESQIQTSRDQSLHDVHKQFLFPVFQNEQHEYFSPTKPFIQLDAKILIPREAETPTSLELLFYYPHQWVFKHLARINRSALAGIVKENTLKGNLAHRFFELILLENFTDWARQDADKWINENQLDILRKEAVPLLLYGFEPDKLYFLNRLKVAVWTLINHIRDNNWKVAHTEKELLGSIYDKPLKGKTDIVLHRDQDFCILDLKWSGLNYRESIIRNEEDLQLVLYSKMLHPEDENRFSHSAYFIIENARLIARTTEAFKNIKPVMRDINAVDVNRKIFEKIKKTFQWRMNQLEQGRIEIRTKHTLQDLEQHYADELIPLLEMKKENSIFDDYLVLLGLIN